VLTEGETREGRERWGRQREGGIRSDWRVGLGWEGWWQEGRGECRTRVGTVSEKRKEERR